ncbi:MAG: hypothetical protein ABW174_09200, partial [Flavitalea sp.]
YFRQALTIIGGVKPPFDISFVSPVSKTSKDSTQILFRIGTAYGGLASKGTIEYNLYRNERFLKNGNVKIDAFGEAPLLTTANDLTDRYEVTGRVYRGKDTMMFKSQVLTSTGYNTISFYPEGGHLVDGAPAKVSFEIRSPSGSGISTNGFLLKNDEIINAFESDIFGLGRFLFQPEAGAKYSIVAADSALKLVQHFPSIEKSGYAMLVQQPAGSDSVILTISTPADSADCAIVIHNKSDVFAELTIRVPKGKGKLTIPSNGWPAGVATISVFSMDSKLKLQSMIRVGRASGPLVTMAVDSAFYLPGSRVVIKVNLKDANGKPVKGIFSLGSVLKKTSDARKSDINSFVFGERHFLQQQSIPEAGYLSEFQTADNILPALKPHPVPAYRIDTSIMDGVVTFNGKTIRKPLEVLAAGEVATITKTDEEGYFRFDQPMLYGKYLSKLLVSVVGKSSDLYKVHLIDKAKALNDSIAAEFRSGHFYRKDELTASEKEQIRQLQGQLLEKVVVKASKNQRAYDGAFHSQSCNDWVCMNQIFNCGNHGPRSIGATPAIEGQYYMINGRYQQYHCAAKKETHIGSMNAIWFDQPFAIVKPGDTAAPELFKRTTLIWAPAIQTDENGNAEISFYTNEVKGNFVAEVQGISNEGVFSKRVEFVVSDDRKRKKGS